MEDVASKRLKMSELRKHLATHIDKESNNREKEEMYMVDMTNWPAERMTAYEKAIQANERKMSKVYNVDNYWREFRQAPTVRFTEEQKKQVEAFWERYSFAYQNDPATQEYYYSISGIFDPRYCAEGLNAYYMYLFYDDPVYHTPFHDKNYREFLFKDFRYTPAVVHRIRDNYYDDQFRPVSYYEAVGRLKEYLDTKAEKVIVKPTPGGGGNGISFLRRGDSVEQISRQLDSITKDDIIIEKYIEAHESYAVANPTSLNSLRIVSFLYEHEVEIISIVFRMGAIGNEVDNFTQGGVACRVSLDGICGDYAVDHFGGKHSRHPNGFEFAGHQLVGIREAVETVKQLHRRVPQFHQMSWDIAIEKDEKPTLIEMNPRGDIAVYQVFGDLPFGERTQEILDDYLLTFFYKLEVERDWDFREYYDHIVLTKYAGTGETVEVPELMRGKTVTAITSDCFDQDSGIAEIVIPGCVKSVPEIIKTSFKTIMLEDMRSISVPAPENLQIEVFHNKNTLSWSPVEGVTNYRIFRTGKDLEKKLLKSVSSCVCTYNDWNILPDEFYYYEVYGYDSSVGMLSKRCAATFSLEAKDERLAEFKLSAPEDFRGIAAPGENRLRWSPVEDATGYYLYRMKQGEEKRFLAALGSEMLRYTDTEVEEGKTYHYEIKTAGLFGILSDETRQTAVCSVGEGQFKLNAPEDFRGIAAPGENRLRWSSVENATGYYLYRMKQGEEKRFLKLLDKEDCSYTDTDVEEGIVYYYEIRSVGSFNVRSDASKRVAIQARL